MNFNVFQVFELVEFKYGNEVLKDVMKMTDDDIKANRVAFGKRTSSKEYMKIFKRSLGIWERHLRFS